MIIFQMHQQTALFTTTMTTVSNFAHISMLLLCVIIPLLTPIGEAKTTVTVTAPVNPVKTGAVISVYCHVRDARKNHEVSIVRQTAGDEFQSLSVDRGILGDIEDRMFLAVRDLQDGSSVYLFSIKDVIRADAGRYSCQVLYKQPGNITEVAVGTVNVEIFHFPSDAWPICTPNTGPLQVKAGDQITMNCSTQIGFPTVDIDWSRGTSSTGQKQSAALHDVQRTETNGMVTSKLSVVVSARDQGASFECKITSANFPEIEQQKCFIGPLIIDGDWVPSEAATSLESDAGTITNIDSDLVPSQAVETGQPKPSSKCSISQCSKYSSFMYWILATAGASGFALFFLIWDVILCVKVRRLRMATMDNDSTHQSYYRRGNSEDIYFEIPANLRGDPSRRLYMTLEKPNSKGECGGGRTLICEGL